MGGAQQSVFQEALKVLMLKFEVPWLNRRRELIRAVSCEIHEATLQKVSGMTAPGNFRNREWGAKSHEDWLEGFRKQISRPCPQLFMSTGSILAHKEGRPGNSRCISALGYILYKVLIGGWAGIMLFIIFSGRRLPCCQRKYYWMWKGQVWSLTR